jgi:hypothetical protein
METPYADFAEFYPFYLSEHRIPACRKLHFAGTSLLLAIAATMIATQQWWLGWLLPIAGYGFAWSGHFLFEKNRPATFSHPFWSAAGDFVMYWQLLTGKIPFEERNPRAG